MKKLNRMNGYGRVLLMSVAIFATLTQVAFAAGVLIPQNEWLSLQGLLVKENGMRYEDGTYTSCFALYASQTGGTKLWEECEPIKVSSGFYQTWLGNKVPLPLVEYPELWIEVQVDNATLPSRMVLTGTPASWRSKVVTDSIFDEVRMGHNVAVRSLNGIQNEVEIIAGAGLNLIQKNDSLWFSADTSRLIVQNLRDSLQDAESARLLVLQELYKQRLQSVDSVLNVAQLRLDSMVQNTIGFTDLALKNQAERIANSAQSGVLSAEDFAKFNAKGDMHKDSLKVLRIIPTIPYDKTPVCDKYVVGSLYYWNGWGSEESGELRLCRYNAVYKVFAWENLQ